MTDVATSLSPTTAAYFVFGNATFEGSRPGIGGRFSSGSGIVSVMTDASGNGYWIVSYIGEVHAFGDATNYGEPASHLPYVTLVTSAVRTPSGNGYWILFSDGEIYSTAIRPISAARWPNHFYNPTAAIFATSDGGGYWVTAANGAAYAYGDAPYDGGMSATHLNGLIVAELAQK